MPDRPKVVKISKTILFLTICFRTVFFDLRKDQKHTKKDVSVRSAGGFDGLRDPGGEVTRGTLRDW